jgi:hypothetical protein
VTRIFFAERERERERERDFWEESFFLLVKKE